MSKRESIARYSLIIKKLRRGPATFEEICNYFELESEIQGYNYVVSKRTFDRDREDIASLYNIDIAYDSHLQKYKIENELDPETNERILEAFDTFNALNLTDRLSGFIHFEDRRPRGTENLYGIIHAIKNRVQLKFMYQGYYADAPSEREVEPLALKEFRNLWYILAADLKDGKKIKTFSLDRLWNMEITKTKFEYPEKFSVKEHFKYSFGIMSSDGEQPETVILSFKYRKGKYIKSLPLHKSQEILVDNEEKLRVKLKIHITHDFYMEVLSHGDEVKVIEPKHFANEIKEAYQRALLQY